MALKVGVSGERGLISKRPEGRLLIRRSELLVPWASLFSNPTQHSWQKEGFFRSFSCLVELL